MSGRVGKFSAHLSGSPSAQGFLAPCECSAGQQKKVFGAIGAKNADDVVIVSALRTAITKARKGNFKNTTPDDLLKAVIEGVLTKSKINPALIQDVVVGNAQQSGAYQLPSRASMLRAGIPDSAGIRAVNRQCSSGLQALASIAGDIKSGFIDVGLACGLESMTHGGNPGDPSSMPPMNMNEIFSHPEAAKVLTPMGVTSDNVAAKFKIPREKQDALAVASHRKAVAAQKAGLFKDEIWPVKTIIEDADGNEKEVVVDQDEGPRADTTLEGLAKLKPVFTKTGTTTAGNSSQVSDGASCVLMMRRSKAEELKLPIEGVFRGFKVVGCDPAIMGIGPAVAIPALLEDVGLKISDIDIFEINEAFASQALYCVEHLGVPEKKLNPKGGAISLGHPLGCTGNRAVATLLPELKRTGGKAGIVSMCIGGGFGAAALITRE